ncbi:hypothetical protein [Mycoplasma nasistruthionis]|nr:hypothetical protein [Mycoplasma nasistruthionis]
MLLTFVNNVINKTIPEIKVRYTTFVKALQQLAPNANINLIAYPML